MAFQQIESGSFVVGQSQTNAVQLNELSLTGITVSASTITGTTMTFLVSTDGINYYPLYDNTGTEVSLTIGAAARSYNVDPTVFFPWNFVKARLGTSASPVLQATYDTQLQFNAKLI